MRDVFLEAAIVEEASITAGTDSESFVPLIASYEFLPSAAEGNFPVHTSAAIRAVIAGAFMASANLDPLTTSCYLSAPLYVVSPVAALTEAQFVTAGPLLEKLVSPPPLASCSAALA